MITAVQTSASPYSFSKALVGHRWAELCAFSQISLIMVQLWTEVIVIMIMTNCHWPLFIFWSNEHDPERNNFNKFQPPLQTASRGHNIYKFHSATICFKLKQLLTKTPFYVGHITNTIEESIVIVIGLKKHLIRQLYMCEQSFIHWKLWYSGFCLLVSASLAPQPLTSSSLTTMAPVLYDGGVSPGGHDNTSHQPFIAYKLKKGWW